MLKGLSHIAPHLHVLDLFREAGSNDKRLEIYDGHFHDLLADTGRERPMGDILSWVQARLSSAR